LTIASGGTVVASGGVVVGGGSGSGTSTLNIGTPGGTDTGVNLIAPTVALLDPNAAINFNQADTFTATSSITGAGNLNQLGTGTTILTSTNSYTGTTTVAGGTSTLEVGTTGTLSGTTNVTVNGGTLLLEGNAQVNPINPSATLTTATGSTIMMGDISQATTRASSQSFTSLTLSGNTVINFSALAGLSTLQLSALTMNGNSLTVLNWEGTTYYGSVVGTPANDTHLMDLTGLSQANLNNISFYSGGTTSSGFLGTAIFSLTNANEIIPVPEPSVVISGLFLLGWLIAGAARGRKKLS
jgi:autotransporter-associated beta strand protein